VYINERVTYITNDVLTSKHDCVFERYTYDLDLPKKLTGFTLYTQYCSMYHKKTCPFYILYCTEKSHRLFRESQCHCELCVKDGPASLKSLCVNKISEFTFYPIALGKRNHCKCKNRCMLNFARF
jgi:hypothetical protein